MAVMVLKHAEKYAGTHAERLAMDVSSVNKGATFFEWDTSELFTLSPTGWVEKIGQVKGEMSLSGSNVPIRVEALKDVLLQDTVAVSIPSSSFSVFSLNAPDGLKYKTIGVGFNSNDTFTNKINADFRSGDAKIGQTDILISGSRFIGCGLIACVGDNLKVVFRNEDTGSAHNVFRYVEGIRI